MEQITYLLFIRRLDDLQILAEKKANRTGKPIEKPIYRPGQADLRWSHFKDLEPALMFHVVGQQVFPFLRQLGGDGTAYGEHMAGARFAIPTPALLARVVDLLEDIPMHDRDTNGDVYEVARLYESPFTDTAPQGPDMIFTEEQVGGIVVILGDVMARAESKEATA